jgi:polyhydroxyalkanoate synthesis regulator phasin
MYDSFKKILTAGVEAQNKMIDFLDELVQKGKIDEKERTSFMQDIHEKLETSKEKGEELINDITDRLIEKSPFVAKKEVDELRSEIRTLRKHISKLEKAKKETPAKKKAPESPKA